MPTQYSKHPGNSLEISFPIKEIRSVEIMDNIYSDIRKELCIAGRTYVRTDK
jgi:hypothetical protein